VKRTVAGRHLDAILSQAGADDARPLVAAPFLAPMSRAALAARSVSYADATGNLRLVADRPGLFVDRQGAKRDPWPSDDALRSLRDRGAGRAVRALVDFRPPYGVRALAQRAGVLLGSLSRTLDLLDREGVVTRGRRGDAVALDWEATIRRWVQDYDFARSNRVASYLDPRGLNAVAQKSSSARWSYAVTGALAAQAFEPIAPARLATVYVEDAERAAEQLRLCPADAGANVLLAEPFDPVVFDRATVRDGLRVVAASQLAADLLTGTGREPSEGDELMAWMRVHENEWRA
jgi:hypothetical protein